MVFATEPGVVGVSAAAQDGFAVPVEVAAAAPPWAPCRTDPTGGLLNSEDLSPASTPPNIPGVHPPAAPPAVPSLPSYGELVDQVRQQGQQLNDMQNSAHNVTIEGLVTAGGAGCVTGSAAAALRTAIFPPAEVVSVPGGCAAGAITSVAGYLATIWGSNAVDGH